MKLKALLLACAVAGAFASFALADDGHHGKHHEHGTTTSATTTGTTTTNVTTTNPANCTRVELRGRLASVSPTFFTLTVTKAEGDDDDNGSGSATPAVGSTVTIAVDANTRVQWQGTGTLTGPNVGDSARVKALSCGSPATFTAQRVKANGPRAGHHEHQHDSKSHK